MTKVKIQVDIERDCKVFPSKWDIETAVPAEWRNSTEMKEVYSQTILIDDTELDDRIQAIIRAVNNLS